MLGSHVVYETTTPLILNVENKLIVEKLTWFHKIIDNIENIKLNIDEEDKIILLLDLYPLIQLIFPLKLLFENL